MRLTLEQGFLMTGASNISEHDKTLFARIAEHRCFRYTVNGLIILNAIQLGLAADYPDNSELSKWDICAHVFTALFVLEILVIIAAYPRTFYKHMWTVFDISVTFVSMMTIWFLPLFGAGEDTAGLNFARIFRLLRLLRIAQLATVLPELKIIVEGLFNSLRSMMWIVLLSMLFVYVLAICCVEVLGRPSSGFAAWNDAEAVVREESGVAAFNSYLFFGNVPRAVGSLCGVILLAEWNIVRPVAEIQPLFVPMFFGAIFCVTFGILNVMIGIVVEKTNQAMERHHSENEDRIRMIKKHSALELAELLFDLDKNGDQRLSIQELKEGIVNPKFTVLLEQLDLPFAFSAAEFLSMLDSDGSGWLNKHEFIHGIQRLLYCNAFHRDCIHNMQVGLHHNATRILVNKLEGHIYKLEGIIHSDIQAVAEEIRGIRPSMKSRKGTRLLEGSGTRPLGN
jgi:hypothetical protein